MTITITLGVDDIKQMIIRRYKDLSALLPDYTAARIKEIDELRGLLDKMIRDCLPSVRVTLIQEARPRSEQGSEAG